MTATDIARMPAIVLIRCYQIIFSPFVGRCCRFTPSCSDYGLEAIRRHGLLKGSLLIAGRLCRCHPFHSGGWDPVPAKEGVKEACSHRLEGLPET